MAGERQHDLRHVAICSIRERLVWALTQMLLVSEHSLAEDAQPAENEIIATPARMKYKYIYTSILKQAHAPSISGP